MTSHIVLKHEEKHVVIKYSHLKDRLRRKENGKIDREQVSHWNMLQVLFLGHCGHTGEPVLKLWSRKPKAFWIAEETLPQRVPWTSCEICISDN